MHGHSVLYSAPYFSSLEGRCPVIVFLMSIVVTTSEEDGFLMDFRRVSPWYRLPFLGTRYTEIIIFQCAWCPQKDLEGLCWLGRFSGRPVYILLAGIHDIFWVNQVTALYSSCEFAAQRLAFKCWSSAPSHMMFQRTWIGRVQRVSAQIILHGTDPKHWSLCRNVWIYHWSIHAVQTKPPHNHSIPMRTCRGAAHSVQWLAQSQTNTYVVPHIINH